MKNVLLLVHDDPGQEARFQAALDLTRALTGHLICLDVAEVPNLYGDPYVGTGAQAQLAAEIEGVEAANRVRLEARLAREDVAWTWLDVTGTIAALLEEHSKTVDLIVVNRKLDNWALQDMRGIAAEVIVESRKAVVAVPEKSRGFKVTGKALIAWNGSDEVMKAVQQVIPLLQAAADVAVLEIEEETSISVEEVASYLSRHGIRPEVVKAEKGSGSIADAIIAAAETQGADYIVMGGFGHSRFLEAVIGGVSREMLGESPLPIVMSH